MELIEKSIERLVCGMDFSCSSISSLNNLPVWSTYTIRPSLHSICIFAIHSLWLIIFNKIVHRVWCSDCYFQLNFLFDKLLIASDIHTPFSTLKKKNHTSESYIMLYLSILWVISTQHSLEDSSIHNLQEVKKLVRLNKKNINTQLFCSFRRNTSKPHCTTKQNFLKQLENRNSLNAFNRSQKFTSRCPQWSSHSLPDRLRMKLRLS